MIPSSVYNYIANAEHHLLTAGNFPYPTNNAALLFFLLTSWENIIIADHELEAWVKKEKIDPQIYRDHSLKYKDLSPIIYRKYSSGSSKLEETIYQTGSDFKKLRETSLYGSKDGSQKVGDVFVSTGWADLTDLQREIYNKIGWIKVTVEAYEAIILGEPK